MWNAQGDPDNPGSAQDLAERFVDVLAAESGESAADILEAIPSANNLGNNPKNFGYGCTPGGGGHGLVRVSPPVLGDPSITVEKQTNGVEADSDALNDGSEDPASTSAGASNTIPAGDPVTWTFQIRNDGAIPLTNVAITDATTTANDQAGATSITCDWAASSDAATAAGNLSVGETVACTATGTAGTGLHLSLIHI